MKYRVTIDGREREVDVTIAPSGAIAVTLDGAKVDAEVRPVPGGVSVRLGTRVHDVIVASAGGDEVQLAAGAARAVAQVLSERARADRKRAGGGASAKELRAPMPGRVVRVLCAAGESVTAGQALVVVEAMKMENELRAPGDATIAQVHVSEGASVEGRALLVTFG
ncbi:biotin/lipoyl-containing protein [Sandaracinus amylolyticus]|uniref:biotin/lipoyl-containing protein n=1 Tax=Sandaracinus amylolyticus TaxID=927083 RepID=UPI002E37A433|nr:acetyl-CoA carboxylase biotin carboxyl carrier protein subunit [Sandaracinus amylolyticus]UJR79126.1 Acetyl-CoA carboxylase biotin carboxyl carrier protein subunit [Sandaracinus amylolyticus]